MEELERVQARLDNISTVEPILGALRTISLGSWQAAQKQQAAVQGYAGRLLALLPSLLPHLPDRWRKAGRRSAAMQRYAGRLLARAPALWRYVPARWLVTNVVLSHTVLFTLALIIFQVAVAVMILNRGDLVREALIAGAIFSGFSALVSSPGGTVGTLALAAIQAALAVSR